jgi:hypothetical protein
MAAVFQPLGGREEFSFRKEEWLRSEVRPGLTRSGALAAVISRLARPTKPEQTIWDGCYRNCKLHDKEPAAVVQALENQWPHFFDGFPVKGDQVSFNLSDAQKRAFIGEWCKIVINQGRGGYGKPELRKGPEEPQSDLDFPGAAL